MPDNSGTWVWKLNGNQWQHELLISNNDANADVKVVGNLAHILLFERHAVRAGDGRVCCEQPATRCGRCGRAW